MALYCIGDVQGCNAALGALLDKLDFSPSRDTLYLLGDMVNRGPDNAGVLRRLMALGSSALCLLGNHDLHLLAIAHGVRGLMPGDTLQDVLNAPDRRPMLEWLRRQRLALLVPGGSHAVLLVHAGVLPQWSTAQTLALAAEVEAVLQGPQLADFLPQMYGNAPNQWHDGLQGADRLRVIVNALTRLRWCSARGAMDFSIKEGAASNNPGLVPWFDAPGRATAQDLVLFGHWAALGWLLRQDVVCLDTGCVWGRCLTAVELPWQSGGQGNGLPQVLRRAQHDCAESA